MDAQDERNPQQSASVAAEGAIGFYGTYSHSIDAKNRIIIPQALRDQLGELFTIARSPDFKTIALYPLAEWNRRMDQFREALQIKPSLQHMINQVTKYSFHNNTCDAQGRVLLPQTLREMILGDCRDLKICGALTFIRVMPAALSDEEDEAFYREYPNPEASMDETMLILRQSKS